MAIESYALTANNITYGVAGETMKYWNFYPAAAGMGRIPVWGFGRVVQSSRPDVAVGERLYGYWPMSSDVLLTIGRATPAALTETSPNRAELASVYNSLCARGGRSEHAAGQRAVRVAHPAAVYDLVPDR